ncbi:MAG: RluA family pseudouridine synthase [Gammaproteobacteria bacterium]|jgi:23S rRNA pseudouridine955/2504/2580 synthase
MSTPSAKPASGVRHQQVSRAEAGQRVDNYLLRVLKGVPRSRIYRILRKGEVRVNGKRIKPEYRLQAGDEVRLPPVRQAQAPKEAPQLPAGLDERLEAAILAEDEYLMILDKPSGLAVHGGSTLGFGVIEALRAIRPNAPFLELAHRLDRATSGCLVVAKTRAVLNELHGLLRDGKVEKHYLALLAGHWEGGPRRVELALSRGEGAAHSKVSVDEAGKAASSLFTPKKRWPQATLADVRIFTGRTHQIRVHAAHIGHPVAGDEKYGDFDFNRTLRREGLKRLFLHASELRFQLPVSGRKYHVQAALPGDLKDFLKTFK